MAHKDQEQPVGQARRDAADYQRPRDGGERGADADYEPLLVERALTVAELEREVLYAGDAAASGEDTSTGG